MLQRVVPLVLALFVTPAAPIFAQTPPASPAQRASITQFAERHALFQTLSSAGLHCGGMREATPPGRVSLVFPVDCFFAHGATDVRADAMPLVTQLARSFGAVRTRGYTVRVTLPPHTPHAFRQSATMAAALVDELVRAGLDAARLTAAGAGEREDEEVYDGPSTLAPGNALVEFALDPAPDAFLRP